LDDYERITMKIAIASGKGGTGKTTVATNLALSLSENGEAVRLLDCDVEEPNCHLFMKPTIEKSINVTVPVPKVDEDKCNGCGECGRICRFSAIISFKTKALTFPELCHSCGGCMLVCEPGAITEVPRLVGTLELGKSGNVDMAFGRLRVGEAMSPPLISRVKEQIDPAAINIIDAPPGTTCPTVEAMRDADYLLLVTEPTPFGLHDLKLAVETIRELGIPHGVLVNRSDLGNDEVKKYCEREQIDILMEIPFDRKLAEAYSRGEMAVKALPEYKKRFTDLFERIRKEVKK
jgi:MinD superfamily P-loop ATPase